MYYIQYLSLYIYIYRERDMCYTYMYVCMYIYIYREREIHITHMYIYVSGRRDEGWNSSNSYSINSSNSYYINVICTTIYAQVLNKFKRKEETTRTSYYV